MAPKSYTEEYLDGTGLFRDAVISILAAIAKQERVRLSERTLAGLERARAKDRVGGRPKVRRDRDQDAPKIRQMRDDGQSYQEIADELSAQPIRHQPRVRRAALLIRRQCARGAHVAISRS